MNGIASVPNKGCILIVDDDDVIRRLLVALLLGEGYAPEAVETGEGALEALEKKSYDLVLLDLNLPEMSGIDVLGHAASLHTTAQFILMTAFAEVDTAVEAMKLGAFDYLPKPLRTEELLLALDRALRQTELRREVAQLRRRVAGTGPASLIGKSPPMKRLFDLIEHVAPTRATVLITGETGTGKELVARAVHELSDRARKPFVPINCSALPETLLESELFGHVKGSFTGAINSRRGLFEEANGGTLFLDEISTISAPLQVKLLRVLQERRVQRIGSSEPVASDFRLISATNEDLEEAVEAGRFREDLFYRLNVYPIVVPPLRERRGDIPLLILHFLERFSRENGMDAGELPEAVMRDLVDYHWPGNVRELENYVERSVILSRGETTWSFALPRLRKPEAASDPLFEAAQQDWDLPRLEREYILRVMRKTDGHRGHAAEILGMDRRTLYRKLKDFGFEHATLGVAAE
jgi:DNA-binding NtrC family response regulator